jgi:hypothetical protein
LSVVCRYQGMVYALNNVRTELKADIVALGGEPVTSYLHPNELRKMKRELEIKAAANPSTSVSTDPVAEVQEDAATNTAEM